MKNGNPNKEKAPASLFERAPSAEYISEWTDTLRKEAQPEESEDTFAVLVFGLEDKWLAIPTAYLKEVVKLSTIRRIPHRQQRTLLGVVNLHGQLQLCVSLHNLLEMEKTAKEYSGNYPHHQARLVAIVKEGEIYVFPVDNIEGIFYWDPSKIQNAPINLSKSPLSFIKGIMRMGSKTVGLIDVELLFPCLKRSLA